MKFAHKKIKNTFFHRTLSVAASVLSLGWGKWGQFDEKLWVERFRGSFLKFSGQCSFENPGAASLKSIAREDELINSFAC